MQAKIPLLTCKGFKVVLVGIMAVGLATWSWVISMGYAPPGEGSIGDRLNALVPGDSIVFKKTGKIALVVDITEGKIWLNFGSKKATEVFSVEDLRRNDVEVHFNDAWEQRPSEGMTVP